LRKFVLVGLIFVFALLIGCSGKDYKIEITQYVYKSVGEPSLKREVVREFEIEDSKSVKTFLGALSTAKKTNKYYDIEPPTYIIKVSNEDKLINIYELWLMDKEGATGIMRIQGEQAWYDLDVGASNILNGALKQ
jgi:hypothetical protein